jgi:ABC-type nitrate/sulfonate/bicarbonate transport system ATPase subunit
MTAALVFRHVSKRFETPGGFVEALHGLSLDVPADRFTAIVGPSGCGKSTLLHIAAGLDTQFSGEYRLAASCSRTAYVFQTPRLLPWLTTVQNVQFILESQGRRSRDARATAQKYVSLVGLEGFEERFPAQLSGGMQQRVALARALAIEPDVMLMDEPFAALDELTAQRIRRELLLLYDPAPRTVLFVTHNVTEAAFLADRVVVLSPRPGRVVAEIPVDLPRPRDYNDASVAAVAREIVSHLELEPIPTAGGSHA